MPRRFIALFATAVLAALCAAAARPAPAAAQAGAPQVRQHKAPRYVSLRAGKANLRQGPTFSHPILWVYRHKGYPFILLNSFDAWRKVRAPDGAEGWMSAALLSPKRTVLVVGKGRAPLYARPGDDKVVALADPGAIADLEACRRNVCRISGEGIDGWIPKVRIWGVGKNEVFPK
jgi:SH3-like domain-containing protein